MERSRKDVDILNFFTSDEEFDRLYPESIRRVSQKHWTRLEVAQSAAAFLSTHSGAKILDIGSGAGKFCLTAAYYNPSVHFTGIEQRQYLVDLCNDLKKKLQLENVDFISGNMKDLDFSDFDHFYFYNAFYENIPGTQKIDWTVRYSEETYDYYNLILYKKLKKTPPSTRLVTFHSLEKEVPSKFQVVHTEYAGLLKFWQKL